MDLAKVGHIGIELAVVGTVAYVLAQQNRALSARVDELSKQLAHTALHVQNIHSSLEARVLALEKLKGSEPGRRARTSLRASVLEDSPPPRARLPKHESPPLDDESDVEAVHQSQDE